MESSLWNDDNDQNLLSAMDNALLLHDGNMISGEPPLKKSRFESEILPSAFGSTTREKVMHCLTKTFGVPSFRGHQEQVISAALKGRDCLVVMPTGMGKSLCYQIPAVLSDGVTIVISPLKSLMHEQSVKMNNIGVRAVVLSSGNDVQQIYSDLNRELPKIKILFATPEMLVHSHSFKTTLQSLNHKKKLARFVFDEAHCLASWGRDFRPEYRKVMWLHNSYPNVPFMALTATATPAVKLRIEHVLGLHHVMSVNRPNIKFSVLPKDSMSVVKLTEIIKEKFSQSCGIIYCMTRKDCEAAACRLTAENISCRVYHAGLPQETLYSAHKLWLKGDVKVMVATNAFGMGIDKSDVRFVFHLHIPTSLENYFQECGRAGRDGLPSECILFYKFEDGISWLSVLQSTTNNSIGLSCNTHNVEDVKLMVKYSENVTECRRFQLLSYFGEVSAPNCSASCCDNFLAKVKHTLITASMEVRSVVNLVSCDYLKITVKQLIDILKGSKQKILLDRGFGNLKYYGLLKKWHRDDIAKFIASLYTEDYLSLQEYKNVYTVTQYVKVGSNQSCFSDDFEFKLPIVSRQAEQIFDTCLEKLMSTVDAMSYALGIERECIFDKQILTQLATELPSDVSQMLKVPGMSRQKYLKYGEPLLDITSAASINREHVLRSIT